MCYPKLRNILSPFDVFTASKGSNLYILFMVRNPEITKVSATARNLGLTTYSRAEYVLVITDITLSFKKKRKVPPGHINMYEMSIPEVHSGNLDLCLLICASPRP